MPKVYVTEAGHLKRFDNFTVEKYNSGEVLTKEIVMEWCTKKPYEKQENLCGRTSVIRQLAIYLNNLGMEAYIIPGNYFKSGPKYIPYIYKEAELVNIFKQTDKCQANKQFPCRHFIMPVLFRMIYTCGLRVSEARLLILSDVDLNKGILTINQSKKDNSRLVPMTDELSTWTKVFGYCIITSF